MAIGFEKLKELKATFATAIAAAFGFVMALAWNDAIKSSVDKFLAAFNLVGQDYLYKIITAIVVTVIAIAGIWIVSRWKE